MQYAVFTNIQCREGHDYNSLYRGRIEETEWAEKLGFDAVFFAEHAFCEHGRPPPVVSLANVAARTSRLRLGTAVSVLPWHNPLEVAQDYATLDILSDGRLEFGVGRGAFKREFDGYGLDWEESQARYLEALEIILKAWTGEPFSYDGRFFKIPEVAVNPMPVQRPHPPLWQSTLTADSMAAVASKGITPIVGASYIPPEAVKKNFAHLSEAIKNAGRGDLRRVAHPTIYVSDSVDKAREEARESVEWIIEENPPRAVGGHPQGSRRGVGTPPCGAPRGPGTRADSSPVADGGRGGGPAVEGLACWRRASGKAKCH